MDKVGDTVDQLAKMAARLTKQVEELAAQIADSRGSSGKGKKKKKK